MKGRGLRWCWYWRSSDVRMHGLGFRAVVVCVWVFIVGCATPRVDTRSVHMEQPEDLRNFVLVIKDTQDGDAAHTWLPMSEFNWPEPTGVDTRPEIESHVEPAALKDRDCEQEQLDCFSRCWKRKPPYPRERNKQGHYAYCQEKCLKEYMECLKATGRAPTRIQGHG